MPTYFSCLFGLVFADSTAVFIQRVKLFSKILIMAAPFLLPSSVCVEFYPSHPIDFLEVQEM